MRWLNRKVLGLGLADLAADPNYWNVLAVHPLVITAGLGAPAFTVGLVRWRGGWIVSRDQGLERLVQRPGRVAEITRRGQLRRDRLWLRAARGGFELAAGAPVSRACVDRPGAAPADSFRHACGLGREGRPRQGIRSA